MFSGSALIVGGWVVAGPDTKSYLGSAEISSFSRRDFSRNNKLIHSIFWHVVSTGCFYALFLWAIAVLDFRPLKIYKNVDLPLSTFTFTITATQIAISVNMSICVKYYTVWNQFFIKIHVKVKTKDFYIQIWFKYETPLLFFLIRSMVYVKKLFIEKK